MKALFAILAACLMTAAHAEVNVWSGSASTSDAQSTSNSGATSANTNANTATNTTAALQGNAQTINFSSSGESRYAGGYTVKSAPSISLAPAYPTSPCMGSSTVGGSGIGFSVGVGSSWVDTECTLRETARAFYTFGLADDAVAILCQSKYAKAAAVCMHRPDVKAE